MGEAADADAEVRNPRSALGSVQQYELTAPLYGPDGELIGTMSLDHRAGGWLVQWCPGGRRAGRPRCRFAPRPWRGRPLAYVVRGGRGGPARAGARRPHAGQRDRAGFRFTRNFDS
jgi:hypothetical protein